MNSYKNISALELDVNLQRLQEHYYIVKMSCTNILNILTNILKILTKKISKLKRNVKVQDKQYF